MDETDRIVIGSAWLATVGLHDLPSELADELLHATFSTLEIRVGAALAATLSDEQMAEFEGFIDTDDEEGTLEWLQRNAPDYRRLVRHQFDQLTEEVAAAAPALLAGLVGRDEIRVSA